MQLEEADADGLGDGSVLGVGAGGGGGDGGDGGEGGVLGGVLGGGEGGGGGGDGGRGLGGGVETTVEAEVVIVDVVSEGEVVEYTRSLARPSRDHDTPSLATTGKEPGLRPQPEPSVLDASTLKPDESLAGRDFSGWTLKGDFSERNFAGASLDGANLRRVVARHADFRDASMRRADASRADFRGACLVGVAVHGAKLRRANCESARMAGMWGVTCDEKPEMRPLEDGTMPPMEPLARTDEQGQKWDKEETVPGDMSTAEEAKEDAEDEAALEAHKRWLGDKKGVNAKYLADVVDMQQMNAQ